MQPEKSGFHCFHYSTEKKGFNISGLFWTKIEHVRERCWLPKMAEKILSKKCLKKTKKTCPKVLTMKNKNDMMKFHRAEKRWSFIHSIL